MKGIIYALFAVLMLSAPLGFAQDDRSGKHLQRLAQQLQLSPDQLERVNALLSDYRAASRSVTEEKRELRKRMANMDMSRMTENQIRSMSGSLGRLTARQNMMQMRTQRDFFRVLTPEQRQRYQTLRQQRLERAKQHKNKQG